MLPVFESHHALGILSGRGTYVNVGLFGGELRAPLAVLALRQLTIKGSFVPSETRELIEFFRAVTIKSIPISTAPISQLNEGLALLCAGKIHGRQKAVYDAH
ncbi:MDR/zinc-dependent alcohol dehydrogenase-like family protein [Sinorhizobium fredii]|uniref:hypothetical protein n=1 Tax=Rhizobium fredii TaxID=380 RepID=UPI0005955CF1|nr:hypothetical protein [Sinorhizobium fredii]WOS65513.1 hypothetical protein SFGR64A_28965 [Sinorhizobium fredii GR64]